MADRIISEIGKQEYRRGKSQAVRMKPQEPQDPAKRRHIKMGVVALAGILGVGGGVVATVSKLSDNERAATQPSKKDTVDVLLEEGIKPDFLFTGDIQVDRKTAFRDRPFITDSNTEGSAIYLNEVQKINGTDVSTQFVDNLNLKNIPFKTGFNPDTHMNDGKGFWGMVLITHNGVEKLRYFSDSATTEQEGVVVPDRDSGSFAKVKSVTTDGIELVNLPMVPRKDVGLVEPVLPKTA